MTNYYCKSCEDTFTEEEVERILESPEVRHPNDLAHPAEYSAEAFCPICGDELTPAIRCKICEEYFAEEDTILFNHQRFCKDCLAVAIVASHDQELRRKLEKELENYLPDANHYQAVKDALSAYYGEGE